MTSKKHDPDIPGTSKPSTCNVRVGEEKCGKPSVKTAEGQVEVMGRMIPVKLRVCEEHASSLPETDGRFSLHE